MFTYTDEISQRKGAFATQNAKATVENMHIPELLSPAGDYGKMEAAFAYGADAVYLGGREFGLRMASKNFSDEELCSACAYAHSRGKRLYLTLNATPRNDEIPALHSFIAVAAQAGVDAFIVADIGVMASILRIAPNAEIHMSTQTGVANYETCRILADMGAKRIVLARELSIDEIAEIKAKISPSTEIEVFVHGAMCVSFSGRCLLSNYMASRDSNRGACAQPCRWKYTLMEEKRPNEYFPVYEDGGTYILNSKDLCLIEHLDKLRSAGVDSFKIEGRVKTEYYVAAVTHAYRKAIDDLVAIRPFDAHNYAEVCKVSHREYYTGFLFGDGETGQNYSDNTYIRDYEISGVADSVRNGRLYLRTKNTFGVGDTLELLTPHGVHIIHVTDIISSRGESTSLANHPEEFVSIPFNGELTLPAYLRKETT